MISRAMKIVALGTILALGGPAALAMDSGGSDKPARAETDYEKGQKAVKVGNYAAALTLLQKAVVKDAKDANAWNLIGYSQRKLKRFDEALVSYKKALAIKPDHLGANEYIGELYLETGKLALAKERLKVLDSACFFGCEEYDELKAAIAAYEAKKKTM